MSPRSVDKKKSTGKQSKKHEEKIVPMRVQPKRSGLSTPSDLIDNALVWNVRFVNTQKAFQKLINLHMKYNFYLIGLMEPWQDTNKLEKYRRRLRSIMPLQI